MSVYKQKLTELEVVDIEYKDSSITITTNCKSKLEFSCSFFDEENSGWDSVDKEYVYEHYGKMHEVHNALIPVTICITFKNDGKDILFDIVDITVDTNIEFNQFTLPKESRSRTDNPYSYW